MPQEADPEGRLPEIVRRIVESYERTEKIKQVISAGLPDRQKIIEIIDRMFTVLYPGYYGEKSIDTTNIVFHIGTEVDRINKLLCEQVARSIEHETRRLAHPAAPCKGWSREVAAEFIVRIPDLREMLALDVQAHYQGDPAAKSFDEIIFCYPGMFAITVYRMAHELHHLGVPLVPRIMTEYAHSRTGIDIHPGAHIGRSFFIDHGTGIVIGETTEIGDRVRIYHGVTLGALSPRKGQLLRGQKRHPTIEDDVTIYPGATLLGGETVIGSGSVIGGNVWLTHSIEPGTKVAIDQPQLRFHNTTKSAPPETDT